MPRRCFHAESLRPSSAYHLVTLVMVLLVAGSAADLRATEPSKEGSIDTEAAARLLERELVAPCCWNQTLASHQSTLADEMRREIRRRLQAGETPETITRSYIEMYGPRILARPPPGGGRRLLYLLPSGFLLVFGLVLIVYWRCLAGSRRAGAGEDTPGGLADLEEESLLRERLRCELEEMD